MKHTAQNLLPLSIYIIIAASPFSISAENIVQNPSIETLSQARNRITTLIDSIDVQKQDCKRLGLSVAELETRQTELHDSLLQINKKIIGANSVVSQKKNRSTFPANLLSTPDSLFDWIIVIVGFIAFFSGILLVAGIIASFRKRRKKSGAIIKERTPPIAHTPPPYQTYTHKGDTRQSPPEKQQLSDFEALHALKQRVTTSDDRTASLPPDSLKTAPVLSEPALSVESKIIAEASQGADINTLSRKYHLSADHIALILKVARKKNH